MPRQDQSWNGLITIATSKPRRLSQSLPKTGRWEQAAARAEARTAPRRGQRAANHRTRQIEPEPAKFSLDFYTTRTSDSVLRASRDALANPSVPCSAVSVANASARPKTAPPAAPFGVVTDPTRGWPRLARIRGLKAQILRLRWAGHAKARPPLQNKNQPWPAAATTTSSAQQPDRQGRKGPREHRHDKDGSSKQQRTGTGRPHTHGKPEKHHTPTHGHETTNQTHKSDTHTSEWNSAQQPFPSPTRRSARKAAARRAGVHP